MPANMHSSLYPPVAVAIALAERSHALPSSSPVACARLALVVELDEPAAAAWSEATQAAHAMREVDWPALVRHFRIEPVERLQRLDPAVLLARLNRCTERAELGTIVPAGSARSA